MTVSELKEQLRLRDEQIEKQAARIKELEKEIQELKDLLLDKAKSKESKPPKEASNFSVSRQSTRRVGFLLSSRAWNCPSRKPTCCYHNWLRTGR